MRNYLTMLLPLVLAAGCATQPPQKAEGIPMQPAYAQASGLASGAVTESRWWELLEDKTLSELVERALAANLDIRVALERLNQSRAFVEGAQAERLPTGGVSGGVQRRQLSAYEAGPPGSATGPGNRYDAGFDASWELDLFGRVANRVHAEQANVTAVGARLEDVRLSVAAETARAYFQLASALERRDLAGAALERQRSIAKIVGARVNEGYSEPLDEKRSSADLHLAAASLPAIEDEIVAVSSRIAVLVGENPSSYRPPMPAAQPWRMQRLAIGSPESLLDTRPDLREAEARVRSLQASAESIRAEFFPRLSVTGFLGFIAGHASTLGAAASQSWLAAPRIGLPLFDVPRIQARLDAARSDQRQALLDYQKRILVAIEDVETSLARYRLGQERLEALRQRVEMAIGASRLARIRYEAGRSDFLELLESERSATAAETDLSVVITSQRIAVISIFKAFGVGWKPAAEQSLLGEAEIPAGGVAQLF